MEINILYYERKKKKITMYKRQITYKLHNTKCSSETIEIKTHTRIVATNNLQI